MATFYPTVYLLAVVYLAVLDANETSRLLGLSSVTN